MKKRKLTATLPDGGIATRTTHRTYTHVIASRKGDSKWRAEGWAGSITLAKKRLAAEQSDVRRGWLPWDYEVVNLDGTIVPLVGPLPEFEIREFAMVEVN